MSRLTLLFSAALLLAAPCRSNDQDPADQTVQDLDSLTLEQLMQVKVEGAALHPQSLRDAPASVTIITAEDIRKYGYRTLAEALSAVRGFYLSNNRTYETVGVRGFDLPGDYASHLLIMVNGHNMADNVSDSMLLLGEDFPVDMNLIKQIEIIRGPASALYGSSAIFATINILTKSPSEAGPPTFTADAGSFGEKRGQVVAAIPLGAGAKLLFSGSIFNNSGESPLFIPEFNTPQTNHGYAINVDGEKGYRLFSNLVWRNWNVTAAFFGHEKIQPVSWASTIFNNRGTKVDDTRDFVEALYERHIAGGDLRWRTYYDSYHYQGRADFQLSDGSVEDNRSRVFGNWVGTQLTYRLRPSPAGDITVGLESSIDIRNLQTDVDVSPVPFVYLSTSHPDRSLAFIAQDEKKLSKRWKLDLGLRFDKSSFRRDFFSPRAALIYQPSEWTVKFLYGRSFRNPSTFQLFYGDGIFDAANPNAQPESADTVEVDVERKLGKRMVIQASGYGYSLRDFLVGVYTAAGLLQYRNDGKIQAEGLELELSGRPSSWLEATASYAVQKSRDFDVDGILENSPQYLAKLRLAVPLGRKFDLSSGVQYQSSRLTLAGASVTPVYLADLTLTSKHLLPNFDIRLGLRNAFNRSYSDPIALNPAVDTIPEPGRSYFMELIAHARR